MSKNPIYAGKPLEPKYSYSCNSDEQVLGLGNQQAKLLSLASETISKESTPKQVET